MDSPKQVQIPTIEQLKSMPLMDMVNKESMRIMTTTASMQRVCSSIHTLGKGLIVPKNTPIFVHLWGIHHNPVTFPDPYEFKPERFSDVSNEANKNWMPFTLGARICKYILYFI
jgi:cytochrome P450